MLRITNQTDEYMFEGRDDEEGTVSETERAEKKKPALK
jgi:hypothetical protein